MNRRKMGLAWGIVIGLGANIALAQNADPVPKRVPNHPVKSSKPATPPDAPATLNKPADKPAAPNKPTSALPSKTSSTATDAAQLPTQATIEMIMNEAVKNITRRYNLNEAQSQKTDEIMKREVNKFLKDHEADVWPVIRDLLASGFGARPPQNSDEVKRIGKAAEPLLKLAKDAIYKGNDEWRQYLNEEQKVKHDYDLREMGTQFSGIEQNFHSWAEGKPVDGGIFPPPSPDKSPPTPRQPRPGLPEPEVEIFVRTTIFETYVEDFIKEYELDPAQIDAARSILTEFKSKAGDFREANRAELTKLAHEHKDAMDAHDRERIAKAESDRKKFLEPVYELFGQMDERLKALLTTAQIERRKTRQAEASSDKTANSQSEKSLADEKDANKPDATPNPPGDKPVNEKPAVEKPSNEKPAESKPVEPKPAEPRPAPAPGIKPANGDKPPSDLPGKRDRR